MELEKLQRDLKKSYNKNLASVDERVEDIVKHLVEEWSITADEISLNEMRALATSILEIETKSLHDEVESLLAQKEQIERQLERKSEVLQELKYTVFNAMEKQVNPEDLSTLAKLHQIKLQSIDLFDILSEMVESAIITALEKDTDGDIKETTQEIIKELTFEAIKEGSLNTIRIRKILSTILQSAIDVSEASPNRASQILNSTLRGMRSGLVGSIDRFKKRLAFIPLEAKHILIEDYDTIMEDLNQTDVLFSQVIQTQATGCSLTIEKLLLEINESMRYDLEELVHISKETAELMRDRFSNIAKKAVKRGSKAMQSPAAQEAKRMGAQAWGIAKTALDGAIKSAKDKIDTKK
ncbi:DUF6781 family protein [Sulfurimonas sp.]|uniref:DUF6781 family protein n=1 Tax=Sulfurimonas sp. TaxID=2022749 RepID=UPI0025E23C2F|nr:DUF6781 family protein [Sulfurimonas sp.]MDD5157973.1 hypothetical protein [Sulfurimonas sp.]